MNEADIEMLEREVKQLQLNPAVAYALMRIQHDLSIMMEKVNRIEQSVIIKPVKWDSAEPADLSNPPF
jgi:sporulation protein YlmC with PRC-barrel domain